jgi:hypothetical protein
MSFLNPLLLVALAAIAVPLLIHLINLRRPEKITFSTLQFFEALRRTTVRNIKIKEYLLLVLRLLAIASIALVLARPFLPVSLTGDGSGITYVIIVDNSPSMQQLNERGTWFTGARESASAFVTNAAPESRFVVLPTHGPWSMQAPVASGEALRLISRIETSVYAFRLPAHLDGLRKLPQFSDLSMVALWFGDFQKSVFEAYAASFQQPLPMPVFAVKTAGEPSPNAAITNIQVLSRILSERRPVQFQVKVAHFGATKLVNAFVSLEVNGVVTGQYPVQLNPGSTMEYVFEWTPPDSKPAVVTAVLEGDSWPFDNRRYLALDMPGKKNLLIVGEKIQAGEDPFFERALAVASRLNRTFEIVRKSPDGLTPEDISTAAVIVLNGVRSAAGLPLDLLRDHLQSGRSLLFIPGNLSEQTQWARFLSEVKAGRLQGFTGEFGSFKPVGQMKRPPADLPLLQDVFEVKPGQRPEIAMPSVYFHWNFVPEQGAIPLLQLDSGMPLVTEQRSGQGTLIVSALGVEPGWSDFPAQAFYPVFWYRVLQYLAHREQLSARETTLGNAFSAVLPYTNTDVSISGTDFTARPVVSRTMNGVKIDYDGLDWAPGVYRINAGNESTGIAVNSDILESDFQTLNGDEASIHLNKMFNRVSFFDASALDAAESGSFMAGSGRGQEIWRLFVVLGVLFLVSESIVARQFKT